MIRSKNKNLMIMKFHIIYSITAYIQEAHISILHSVCEVLEEMKKYNETIC